MQKRIVFGALSAVLAVFLGAGGTGFAQVEVTECRQVVPRGQTGVLMADLECPTEADGYYGYCILTPEVPCDTSDDCPSGDLGCSPPTGVTLDDRATLDLNGHTISGGSFGVWVFRGRIRGPGQIVAGDQGYVSARVLFGKRLEISDVTVDGGNSGIYNGGSGRLYATNVTANNALEIGISTGTLKGSNITANGNGVAGINAWRVRDSTNITANFNGGGSWGGGDGIYAVRTIVATHVETKGNTGRGVGVYGTARLTGLVSMNNGGPGFESQGHVMLLDSTLSGNDTSGGGIDILSRRQPRSTNTTCSRSERIICEPGSWGCSRTGESWGVCSLD